MKSKRLSIHHLRSIVTDIVAKQDEVLIDKAASTLLALLDEDFDPREQWEHWPLPEP